MSLARHNSGPEAALRAFGSQVHPVFMLPPLAASVFGAVLTREPVGTLAVVHVSVVFCALYTAHVKDGYVDFYLRGEDDDHPLTERGCRLALALATTGFVVGTVGLGLVVGPVAAALCVPGWLVGYFHAPQLDTRPVSATLGYPVGIGFALLGGHYVQSRTLSATALSFAAVFVTVLAGIKIIDDATDYAYDRSIGKRTVAVVLGRQRVRQTAYGVILVGLACVVVFVLVDIFPPASIAAVVVFGVVVLLARRAGDDDRLATMLLVRGSYLFLAVLVVAVWFRPLAGLG